MQCHRRALLIGGRFYFFLRCQDDHNRTWFSMLSTSGWLAFRLDLICVVFVAFVVFLAIATQAGSGT